MVGPAPSFNQGRCIEALVILKGMLLMVGLLKGHLAVMQVWRFVSSNGTKNECQLFQHTFLNRIHSSEHLV